MSKDATEPRPDLVRLRDATQKVVGSVFFGEMFRSMRDSEMKGDYGHGGRAEEMFSAQLHGILAERMGQRSEGGLADALYKHLEKQQNRITRTNLVETEASI